MTLEEEKKQIKERHKQNLASFQIQQKEIKQNATEKAKEKVESAKKEKQTKFVESGKASKTKSQKIKKQKSEAKEKKQATQKVNKLRTKTDEETYTPKKKETANAEKTGKAVSPFTGEARKKNDKTLTNKEYDQFAKAESQSTPLRFASNALSTYMDVSPVGTAYSIIKGENLSEQQKKYNPYYEELTTGKGANAGKLVGMGLGYATQYGAVSKSADAVIKGTKLGQKIVNSGKLGKIGQKVALELTKDAALDSTLGLVQNVAYERGEGKTGKDLVASVAKDQARDYVIGAGMDMLPVVGKALGNTKLAKSLKKADVDINAKEISEAADQNVKVKDLEPEVKAEAPEVKAETPEVKVNADGLESSKKGTVKANKPKNYKEASAKIEGKKAEIRTMRDEASKEFDRVYEKDKSELVSYIKNYEGKKADTVKVQSELGNYYESQGRLNNDSAFSYRVSNNEEWYQGAVKQYGSNKAVKAHAEEIADSLLKDELNGTKGVNDFASDELVELKSILDDIDVELNGQDRSINALFGEETGLKKNDRKAVMSTMASAAPNEIPPSKVTKTSQSKIAEDLGIDKKYESVTDAQNEKNAKMRVDVDADGEFKDLIERENWDSQDIFTASELLDKDFSEGNGQKAWKMANATIDRSSKAGQDFRAFRKFRENTPNGMVIEAVRTSREAMKSLEKSNPNLVKAVDKNADGIIADIGKASENAFRKTAENLIERYKRTVEKAVENSVETKLGLRTKSSKAPLDEAFMQMQKEFEEILTTKPIAEQKTAFQKLVESIDQRQTNFEEYADVLSEIKVNLLRKYEKTKYAKALKEVFDYELKNFSDKKLNNAVDETVKNLGMSLEKICKSNRKDKAKALKEIEDFLTTKTGANETTKAQLREAISERFNKIVNDKTDSIITNILKPKTKTLKNTTYDRLASKINLSYMFFDESVEKGIKEVIKESEAEVTGLVKKNAKTKSQYGQMFADILARKMKNAGVGEEYIEEITKRAKDYYEEYLQESAEKILHNRFKPKVQGKKYSLFNDVMDLINMGAYDNDDIVNLIRAKGGLPVLTSGDIKKIHEYMEKSVNATTDYDKRRYKAMAEQIIADTKEVTMGKKLKALQRISLLGSPKTWFSRNAGGNIILASAETIKDIPAAAMDILVSKATGQRTTSLNPSKLTARGKGMWKGLKEQAKDVKYKVDTSPSRTQYELPNSKVFKGNNIVSRTFNALDSLTSNALKFGDRPFFEGAYASRKAELEDLVKKGKASFTPEEIEEAATLAGLDATFQKDSKLAKQASQFRDSMGAFGHLLVPFTQTPANIFDKLIDYTPAAVVRMVHQLGDIKKGTFDQKAFVDTVGRCFTGGGAITLGYLLHQKGLMTTDVYDSSENYDEYKARSQRGEQNYALEIDGKTYTVDWADPIGSLLCIGAEFSEGMGTSDELLKNLYGGVATAFNGIFDRSFIEGVASFIVNMKGDGTEDGKEPLTAAFESIAEQTISQSIPNLLKAINRVVDDTKRETYDENFFKKQMNVVKSNIPVLSKTLPAKVDILGNEVKQFQGRNTTSRALESLLIPTTITEKKANAINDECIRLYDETGNTNVLLNSAIKKFSYKGAEYKVSTNEQLVQMQKDISGYAIPKLNELINSADYKKMTTAEKADAVAEINDNAVTEAKMKFLISSGKMTQDEYDLSTLSAKQKENIATTKANATSVKSIKDEVASPENSKYLTKSGDMPDIYKAYIGLGHGEKELRAYDASISDKTIEEAKALKKNGITMDAYYKAYLDSRHLLDNSDGVKKDEAIAYLESTKYSKSQKAAIFDALIASTKVKNPYR